MSDWVRGVWPTSQKAVGPDGEAMPNLDQLPSRQKQLEYLKAHLPRLLSSPPPPPAATPWVWRGWGKLHACSTFSEKARAGERQGLSPS
eukprot:7867338-Alexandrium_andersonii.AAC.1